MSINPYLYFNGQCGQAFDFYREIFGGEFIARQTYKNAPSEYKVPLAEVDKIMHISFPIGKSILMGADIAEKFGTPPVPSNNFALSYAPATRDEVDHVFKQLSKNGKVKMEMQETFWGSYFGMCKDQFDIQWLINFNTEQQ